MKKIVEKYGLDLNEEWNQEIMQHLGRHPNEYHEFILHTLEQIDAEAAGDTEKFIILFEVRIKQYILRHPELLRKIGWKDY